MAQWQKLLALNLAPGVLAELYERKFPRHVRHSLCHCIESQDWDSAAVDEDKARACFRALLQYLEEQRTLFAQEGNFLSVPDFPGMKDCLLTHFEDEPLNLARVLSECLRKEKDILALASPGQACEGAAADHEWDELRAQTSALKKEVESLEVSYKTYDHGGVQPHAAVGGECLNHANSVLRKYQAASQEVVNILNRAGPMVAALTEVQLPEWRSRQQMSCIGRPVDTCLDHLQKGFTTVAEVLLQVRRLLQKLQNQKKKNSCTDASGLLGECEKFTLSLLTKLLQNALVVEKQPVMSFNPQRPLIVKTKTGFSATVRFLANLPEFQDLCNAKAVFDKDVEETLKENKFRQFCFTAGHSQGFYVKTDGGGLVAEFTDMKLKESGVRRGCQVLVTEELHIIKFVVELQLAGLRCDIEASSLPVVVITSSNQGPAAWASVMWCNASSPLAAGEPANLLLFVDPPPLSWQQLSLVLSWQFLSVGQRGLDPNQLSMLREKIVDDPEGLVHWSQFKSESTWTWIDGILDLIKEHLKDLWRDGHITGFMSRKKTSELLQDRLSGTFLLRFSESNMEGAITFSWVEHANGETHVHAIEPYTKLDLSKMSMADFVCLYSVKEPGNITRNPLLYLYPDIHKDAAFGRYWSGSGKLAPKTEVNGYIDRKLVPISNYPTPPSSPLRHMEVDPEESASVTGQAEEHQWIHQYPPDLPGSPVSMSHQDAAELSEIFSEPCFNFPL